MVNTGRVIDVSPMPMVTEDRSGLGSSSAVSSVVSSAVPTGASVPMVGSGSGQCAWFQSYNATSGRCELSGKAALQSVFGIPAMLAEPALLSLPVQLVPVAGLAVNIGGWYLVWKVIEGVWFEGKRR